MEATAIPRTDRTTALVPATRRLPVGIARPARLSALRTVATFLRRGACSNTLMTVLDRAHGHPLELEERATDPLAGGMMMGYQCGMLWGSALAAGAEAHRRLGAGPAAEAAALEAANRVVSCFRGCHQQHVDCLAITEADPRKTWQVLWTFLFKGETVRCFRRAARFAPIAHRAIDEALADATGRRDACCSSGNCAATLARTLGASELQVTMAAALAGGIGRCGGACGALGAAIWLVGIADRTAGRSRKVMQQRTDALVAGFQKATDYELECATLVGRNFASAEDHARHVRAGGCAALLETLARTARELAPSAPDPSALAA